MIDSAMLKECSLKHRLEQREIQRIALGIEVNPILRTADTVHGLLSRRETNELLEARDPEMLITQCGLSGISDDKVVFLAGEGSYGWPLLSTRGFMGMSLVMPCRMPSAGDPRVKDGVMRTAEEFLGVYYSDSVHLDSVDDLLAYLNDGVLPNGGRTVAQSLAAELTV